MKTLQRLTRPLVAIAIVAALGVCVCSYDAPKHAAPANTPIGPYGVFRYMAGDGSIIETQRMSPPDATPLVNEVR